MVNLLDLPRGQNEREAWFTKYNAHCVEREKNISFPLEADTLLLDGKYVSVGSHEVSVSLCSFSNNLEQVTEKTLSRFCQKQWSSSQAVSVSYQKGGVVGGCSSVEGQIGMRQSLKVRKIHIEVAGKFHVTMHHLPYVGVSLKVVT